MPRLVFTIPGGPQVPQMKEQATQKRAERAAFFAFLASRFSFRVADASFLFFFPPFSFDAIRGLLNGLRPGQASCRR